MELKIIYDDENVLAVDKPAGIAVYSEQPENLETLIAGVLEKYPEIKKVGEAPRYGIVHRLDKDTSGIILIAKNNKTLDYLQEQFKLGKTVKKYLALATGRIIQDQDKIETLIGRDRKNRTKQRAYLFLGPQAQKKGLRKAMTEYKVLKRFENYTLLEVMPKTGRKHQIRVHFLYLGHPLAGDNLYGFKNQSDLEGLKGQFLRAASLKIKLPDDKEKEFKADLPENLKNILNKLDNRN